MFELWSLSAVELVLQTVIVESGAPIRGCMVTTVPRPLASSTCHSWPPLYQLRELQTGAWLLADGAKSAYSVDGRNIAIHLMYAYMYPVAVCWLYYGSKSNLLAEVKDIEG